MSSPADAEFSPLFIGMILNVFLYGILVLQTSLYFSVYKKDKLCIKIFVAVLFICDTLNTCLDIALVYIPLISKYGDLTALEYATWLIGADPAMTAIIASMVQAFYAWRMKVLIGSWPLVIVVVCCAIGQWFGGMGTAIAIKTVNQYQQFQRFRVPVIIWLSFAFIGDTVITASLVRYLQTHKTGLAETDDAIRRIIRLTVPTGMITAIWAILDLVCYVAVPTPGIHLIFNLSLSKLYSNSLLSSLNQRKEWGYGRASSSAAEWPTLAPLRARVSIDGRRDSANESAIGVGSKDTQRVYIDVETIQLSDHDSKLRKASESSRSSQIPAVVGDEAV